MYRRQNRLLPAEPSHRNPTPPCPAGSIRRRLPPGHRTGTGLRERPGNVANIPWNSKDANRSRPHAVTSPWPFPQAAPGARAKNDRSRRAAPQGMSRGGNTVADGGAETSRIHPVTGLPAEIHRAQSRRIRDEEAIDLHLDRNGVRSSAACASDGVGFIAGRYHDAMERDIHPCPARHDVSGIAADRRSLLRSHIRLFTLCQASMNQAPGGDYRARCRQASLPLPRGRNVLCGTCPCPCNALRPHSISGPHDSHRRMHLQRTRE